MREEEEGLSRSCENCSSETETRHGSLSRLSRKSSSTGRLPTHSRSFHYHHNHGRHHRHHHHHYHHHRRENDNREQPVSRNYSFAERPLKRYESFHKGMSMVVEEEDDDEGEEEDEGSSSASSTSTVKRRSFTFHPIAQNTAEDSSLTSPNSLESSKRRSNRTQMTLSQIQTVGHVARKDSVHRSSTLPHPRSSMKQSLSRRNSVRDPPKEPVADYVVYTNGDQKGTGDEASVIGKTNGEVTERREDGDGQAVVVEYFEGVREDDDGHLSIEERLRNDEYGCNYDRISTVYKIEDTNFDTSLGNGYNPHNHYHSSPHHHHYSRNGEKDGLLLFQRKEQGGPMKQWLSGWQNGKSNNHTFGKMVDDKQSTLSRYWTMDRSLQRRLQKTNFQHIKRLCRDRGQLFEDADFPTSNKSVYKTRKPPHHPIVWLRPHEICQRPKFISEGATRFDVDQGEHGDPWLLAAVSSLTLTPKFLDRVVPPDQNFDHGYCGIFRFRFWHFGDWVEVLIDDRLPTYKGRLIFLHSSDPSEFWAALLEKAYAKLYGCYEALSNGFTTKALQDLTGGIVQSFTLNSHDRMLTFQVLNSAVPRSTLLIASVNVDQSKQQNKRTQRLRNGLVTRHAYSVTGLARVRDTHLVRLRNPWGKGEWNGAWSERSWEWDSLGDRDKELLSVRVRNEGEFWMSFEDFVKQFSHLDLVHIGPDDWMSESALHSKKPWRAVLARRRWRSGYNAGGSPAHLETTAMNPQFHIQIPRSSSSSSSSSSSNKCHVVVSVTQQYDTNVYYYENPSGGSSLMNTSSSSSAEKKRKRKKRRKLHHIGFAVYEVPPHMTRLTPHYVAEQTPLDVTNHSVAREVVTFFTLPPGDYVVVPQTNVPNCDGKFLLRILTDEQSNIWEVNEDNVLFRNVLGEFEESLKYGYNEESSPEPSVTKWNLERFICKNESRILLSKLISKYPQDIDASILQKILRNHWKSYLLEKPSLELCKSLVMLRDFNISGKLNMMEMPFILHLLQFWKTAFLKYASSQTSKTSSFNLRLILWEAGITVSNKVLECLVLRFVKNKLLSSEAYMTVMVRLHLAHERYHSIDTKMKGNPLSLEEMILMTIYS